MSRSIDVSSPLLYDPRHPVFSLLRTVLVWFGIWLCIDVLFRSLVLGETGTGPYAQPWLLLLWTFPGIVVWWADKLNHERALAKRCEASLIVVSRPDISRKAHP